MKKIFALLLATIFTACMSFSGMAEATSWYGKHYYPMHYKYSKVKCFWRKGHRICCRWVRGHWRKGHWIPPHRVCWRD